MGEKPTADDEAEERKSGAIVAADYERREAAREAGSDVATGRQAHEAAHTAQQRGADLDSPGKAVAR